MSCSSSEALFEGYLDDTLAPARRAELLAHLRGCGACKGVLDELRVVDALLAAPRAVALPQNFTFATMAEVGALPSPRRSRAPLYAYLVSYLVAAWLLIGAGFVLAATTLRAFGETALDASGQLMRAAGAIGHAGSRMAADFGGLGGALGAFIVADLMVILVLIAAFRVVRPRVAARLRS